VAARPAAPYRGIHPFRFVDHPIFFAREAETEELMTLVSVYRGVMLYGDSGAGKSSLVNAGLLPEARGHGLEPVLLRVQPKPGEEIVVDRVATVEAGSKTVVAQLASDDSPRIVLSAEAFERRLAEISKEHRLLIVFDQFEELTTLAEHDDAGDAQRAIVELIERVLHGTLAVKLLFAFRDDYLGKLKHFLSACPELVDQALRITPPGPEALTKIVRGPFEAGLFEHQLSLALTDALRAQLEKRFSVGEVSLTQVQIVCARLWSSSDPEALLAQKGVQGILEAYLGEALDAFPDDQNAAALALLGQMVTASGTRNVISRDDLVANATRESRRPERVVKTALERLESESRLVQSEPRRDTYIYEVTSEFLLPWIAERRDEFRQAETDAHYRRRLLFLSAAVVVLALVAGVVTWFAVSAKRAKNDAVNARKTAATESATARSTSLVFWAERFLGSRPDVSLALALGANQIAPRGRDADARDTMIAALESAQRSGAAGILHGHTGGVGNVAFDRTGRILASAGFDRTVRLWDVPTHRQIGNPLEGNESFVNGVAFSTDGRRLASAGEDGKIRMWSVGSRKRAGPTIDAHAGRVYDVAFSPDGSTIASADEDGTVRLWDVASGGPRGVLTGHSKGVYAVDYSRDGRYLASASDDGTARLWDGHTGAWIDTLPRQRSLVRNVAFSPDGQTLALATDNVPGSTCSENGRGCGAVTLFDVRTRKRIGAPLSSQRGNVRGIAFSADGRMLASASYDRTVQLWNVQARRRIGAPITGATVFVSNVAFSPDGRTLAAASFDRTIRLWALGARPKFGMSLGKVADVRSVAYSPDGTAVASAEGDGTIALWDPRAHAALGAPLKGHDGPASGVAFTPDGERLASVGDDGTVRLWDVAARRRLGSPVDVHAGPLRTVAVSHDGRLIAVGARNGEIRLLDAASRQWVGLPLRGHKRAVDSVAFSPDDARLASGGEDNTIRLWDVHSRRSIEPALTGHTSAVNAVAFSPDGRTLASAGDLSIRIWDVHARRSTGSPLVSPGRVGVTSLAFRRDGQILAAGDSNRTIQLWDVRTRRPVGSPMGQRGAVNQLAFSPDGLTLASGGPDGVRLWEGLFWSDLGGLRRRVCELLGTGLSRAEWSEFAPGIQYRAVCPR
jgi:WD40 repeat protein